MVPIISYLQLGWMVGFASVPFNADWGRKNPRRQALMSLAGPMADTFGCSLALGLDSSALLAAHVFQYSTLRSAAGTTWKSSAEAARVPRSARWHLRWA